MALVVSLTACAEGDERKSRDNRVLPDANGGILEIMVVAPDKKWEGMPGNMLRRHFTRMQYGLPQPLPLFNLRQIEPADYKDLLKRSRYQILLNQEDSVRIQYVKNQYAKNQLLIYLSAPSDTLLTALIQQKEDEIASRLKTMERARLRRRMAPLKRAEISPVYAKHKVRLNVPKDYDLDVEEEDLLVYWKKTNLADKGIIVHFRPYPKNEMILGQEIIPLRDSLTELYIRGERDNSFMVTETLIKPQLNAMDIEGRFAYEARGLWRTEHDIMGGPFLSYTIYDEQNEQVIYLDAFIFAPDERKRNALFEMEAILRSIEFLN